MSGALPGLRARLRLDRDEGQVRPRFVAGSRVVWECDVRNRQTNALTDVSLPIFTWVGPAESGFQLIDDATRLSAGVYRSALVIDLPGLWTLRFDTATPAVEADERSFTVLASAADDDADPPAILVTPEGEFLVLDDGQALGG